MDGATKLSTAPGQQVSCRIEKPRNDVADFHLAEMPRRGWALTKEGCTGYFPHPQFEWLCHI
jgi:hypothetical protein